MELDTLIETLEYSVKKNGEKPLTNLWLLNILKQVRDQEEKEDERLDIYYSHDELW